MSAHIPTSARVIVSTVYSLQTSGGELLLPPDTEVIVAAEAWTPRILWMAGIWAPVYPMVSHHYFTMASSYTMLSPPLNYLNFKLNLLLSCMWPSLLQKGYSITIPIPDEVPPNALPHQTVSDKLLTIAKLGNEVWDVWWLAL